MKKVSKQKRFNEAILCLKLLFDEYLHWREAMPENLSDSDLAFQLDETIEYFDDIMALLSEVELPQAFGR